MWEKRVQFAQPHEVLDGQRVGLFRDDVRLDALRVQIVQELMQRLVAPRGAEKVRDPLVKVLADGERKRGAHLVHLVDGDETLMARQGQIVVKEHVTDVGVHHRVVVYAVDLPDVQATPRVIQPLIPKVLGESLVDLLLHAVRVGFAANVHAAVVVYHDWRIRNRNAANLWELVTLLQIRGVVVCKKCHIIGTTHFIIHRLVWIIRVRAVGPRVVR